MSRGKFHWKTQFKIFETLQRTENWTLIFEILNTQNENGLKMAWKAKSRCYVLVNKKKSEWEGVPTFGSIGFIYRPLSSENMTFFALPAFPRRLCACCAKKRSFSSTKPPSASKINSSGICSCSCSFSSSFSSCLERASC